MTRIVIRVECAQCRCGAVIRKLFVRKMITFVISGRDRRLSFWFHKQIQNNDRYVSRYFGYEAMLQIPYYNNIPDTHLSIIKSERVHSIFEIFFNYMHTNPSHQHSHRSGTNVNAILSQRHRAHTIQWKQIRTSKSHRRNFHP